MIVLIRVKRVSNEFIADYVGSGNGMYKWVTRDGKIIDKGIFLGEDAGVLTLLHEFIHHLNHLFRLPQPILNFMDVIMHPKWWISNRNL